MIDALILDVRYGMRQLFRQRGSTIVAVLTLALGIGMSSAIFSVIDATLLRPLPYPDPEQLVRVMPEEVQNDGRISLPSPSMEDMRSWQAADDVFSAVAGWGGAFRGRIADGPQPERVQVLQFTESYLSIHGVTPMLGRDFTREDTEPGSALVALLGYGYWQSHYGGRQDVLGETIRLDADVATIVGVLPRWFNATTPLSTPLRISPKEFSRRGTGRVSVYARLRPDVTIEQARVRLSARMTRQPRPDGVVREVREVRAAIRSELESTTSQARTTVNVLAGAVGLILLLACVNVAGLLLARGAARQPELAVRASLGAGRGRLIRQLLAEGLVLALPGGAIGVLLAWLSLDAIVANIPLSLSDNAPVALNLRVLAATAALLLPATLLFGLVPAIRLSRVRIGSVLARGGRQIGSALSGKGGQLLIAVEIALAVVLVAGAGLMIRSFLRISAVDLGFNPDGLVTMQVLPLDRNPAVHTEYYSALLRQIRMIPGLSSAGLVDNFALGGGTSYSSVSVEGKSVDITMFEVMPGYFETIGARLRQGRLPTEADYASGVRGTVINESAARAFFPGGQVVGRTFTGPGRDTRPWTVFGVITDLRHRGPLDTRLLNQPQVFFPFEPSEFFDRNEAMTVVMRSSGSVPELAGQLRRMAQSIGPRVLVEGIRTGHDWFGDRVITPRRRTVLLGLLGGLGLVLALVGVFGMTAYAVSRRTAEIGIRMAFGARPAQLVQTMVRDSAIPIAIGIAIGVGGAALAARAIESFLFETAPTDPVTLVMVTVTLAAAGCLAALLPALRAAKVDPASSLRAQ
jgi:putative ABC transport system permease protein